MTARPSDPIGHSCIDNKTTQIVFLSEIVFWDNPLGNHLRIHNTKQNKDKLFVPIKIQSKNLRTLEVNEMKIQLIKPLQLYRI